MRLFNALTDAELAVFRGELAKHIGADEAAQPSWQKRAVLSDDGTWLVEYLEPKVRILPHPHAPWVDAYEQPRSVPVRPALRNARGMEAIVRRVPIADAVAVLKGESNPENEVRRREQLFDDAMRAAETAVVEQWQREKEQKDRAREWAARRPERWAALPRESRALYVAAANHPRTPTGALLEAARALASEDALRHPPSTFEPEHIS